MKRLGVIGGLGPMASAYFLELLVQMTDASTDQEHLDVILLCRPTIPDRTAAILDPSRESPVPMMREAARELERIGACCIAVPCITSHHFFEELQPAVSIPFLHLVRETVSHLREQGVKKAGILATTGTIRTRLFQDELERQGLSYAIPDAADQEKVMHLIYKNVKAGLPPELPLFEEVSTGLREQGAECAILGCTELSLIKRDYPLGPGYLDALEVLAKASIEFCEKPLKPDFQNLITR